MEKQELKEIIHQAIGHSMSFQEYSNFMQSLTERRAASGPKQTESYINYTKLNNQRMTRLAKTATVTSSYIGEIQKITSPQTWLIITESWCGDAAQVIPVLQKLANENDVLDTRFVLRDENLELMDLFLTRGGRSIPKLIALDKNFEVLATWGPRPAPAQDLYDSWKNEENQRPYSEFAIELQKWYLQDKGESIYQEVLDVVGAPVDSSNV